MSQITGGKITYGRTVKTGDYENKRMDAEIGFSVGEGEDHGVILETATKLAVSTVHGSLGIRGTTPPAGTRTKADLTAEAEAKAGKPIEVAAPAKTAVAKMPTPPAEDPAAVTETDANVVTEPAVADDLADLTGETVPAKEITDAEVISAVKKKNDEVKNPLAIRQLAAKIGGLKSLKSVIEVPQGKRSEFLAELANLTAAA